jgi:FAD/FMN-containing dehydrogenase/Fe-S oxidoreductase
MFRKGPHLSIAHERLIPRVLGLAPRDLAGWPQDVLELTRDLAAEMFLVRYNPFIDPAMVKKSVRAAFEEARPTLSERYAQLLGERMEAYWRAFDADQAFKAEVVTRLRAVLPPQAVMEQPNSLIETSTDATDLRMELPMLVLSPETTAQVQGIVRLAGEMGFSIVPRGGGTGLTGGAIPGNTRTVMLSLSKMKRIIDIDTGERTLCVEAGVLTLNAIKAADELGLLFTVDPASKAGSSIGGNISENSGGPFAFEYGTTLDNILSYRMVLPDGAVVDVVRSDHPRRKILPGDTAVFEVRGEDGQLKEIISLRGDEIRGPNLGKDVTNKFLGGLPGVQKEGVDGIITEAAFICYPKPALSRTLCLEFYGRSMHNAMRLITQVVSLRDRIREQGDLVKISALEEFGPKYVQAINYVKKSATYEGEPISVLLLQLDSDDASALDQAVGVIVDLAQAYDNVDVFAAEGEREAEHFWEDRHKLSAIAKRTSGFKVNEDIVIPLSVIPEFSDFLENLNLHYLAKAYRKALKEVTDLPRIPASDQFIDGEFEFAKSILRGAVSTKELNDQELEVQIAYFFRDLGNRYPDCASELTRIHDRMEATRIVVANHMHAGDGNCHVNFPVNSADQEMLAQAYEAAGKVFDKVLSLGGAVTGEHGIGITKIGYLSADKIEALRAYKARVDPKDLINPGKLTRRELSVEPYTFSFNRLIQDLDKTALPDKERLMQLLQNIQTCTRCGKCKQVCPMYHPQAGLLFHPRNKNISLGAIIEAVYYSMMTTGQPDGKLLGKLRELIEHCTACGKCFGVCPVKIDSSDVALNLRAFLEQKKSGGHPIKSTVLRWLAKDPQHRVPAAAKLLSAGQRLQEKAYGFVPSAWRRRFENPMFSGVSPRLDAFGYADVLKLGKTYLLAPEAVEHGRDIPETVLYFPGCGAGLFSSDIALAGLFLLLAAEVSVIVPDRHLCCGYPLLAQGLEEAFLANYGRNIAALRSVVDRARRKGFKVSKVLTSCGTCREALHRSEIAQALGEGAVQKDVSQFLFERVKPRTSPVDGQLLYHASCHAEWAGVASAKAAGAYRKALADFTGLGVNVSPGCCGESGLGALTSPNIYNRLRAKKKAQLGTDLSGMPANTPIVVGCPSCKVGIKRTMLELNDSRPVLHSVELLAASVGGKDWRKRLLAAVAAAPDADGLRFIPEL